MAPAYVFLASTQASYITAESVNATGGTPPLPRRRTRWQGRMFGVDGSGIRVRSGAGRCRAGNCDAAEAKPYDRKERPMSESHSTTPRYTGAGHDNVAGRRGHPAAAHAAARSQ
ncbi:hypothetical protein GCM10011583_70080 [Streptomyces camponoticapitis]|uniref:Uncharacterized protein n=1 Tax=Streptomyces camponoticapitis TaxID=1616125 RepID=A0ABQ2EVQ7_9ACTN|nr:hypothetical protein GCM10011583_70080 [Streptomyces camponoticapitis]